MGMDTTGQSASDIRANGGKYVPVHMRAGTKGAGESMNNRNRDDLPTLRVTNLSEDAQDGDLWELFGRFGKINRIYLGKDQDTGLCKGFAFVSFESKAEAEKAMSKINGLPYDHLILACAWSGELCFRPFVLVSWWRGAATSSGTRRMLTRNSDLQCPRSRASSCLFLPCLLAQSSRVLHTSIVAVPESSSRHLRSCASTALGPSLQNGIPRLVRRTSCSFHS